jgi:hypothetical protein
MAEHSDNGDLVDVATAGDAHRELVPCRSCRRANSLRWLNCIYCGYPLTTVQGDRAEIKFEPAEPWENGHSIVLVRLPETSDSSSFFASLGEDFRSFNDVAINLPFPIARVRSSADAETLRSMLNARGAGAEVIADEELDQPVPVRLRSIQVAYDGDLTFVPFNTNKPETIAPANILLLVSGHLSNSRVDIVQPAKGRSRAREETELSKDEAVLDIYTRESDAPFRVLTSGFDFSGLLQEKSFIASENIQRLAQVLADMAPSVRWSKDYRVVSRFLTEVWPPDTRTDAKGLRRAGLGKVSLERSHIVDNVRQFTRYSRLRRLFYEKVQT